MAGYDSVKAGETINEMQWRRMMNECRSRIKIEYLKVYSPFDVTGNLVHGNINQIPRDDRDTAL